MSGANVLRAWIYHLTLEMGILNFVINARTNDSLQNPASILIPLPSRIVYNGIGDSLSTTIEG